MSPAAVTSPASSHDPVVWYRVFYVACIAAMSAVSIAGAHGVHDHHAWLAAIEMVAALMLLPARTRAVGLSILLVVYATAMLLTIHAGGMPIHLVLYAGTAIFLVSSGRSRAYA